MKIFSILSVLFLNTTIVTANFAAANEILDLKKSSVLSLDTLVDTIKPGDILVIGESHAVAGEKNLDQVHQKIIIDKLIQKYGNVSVGMEFIEFTNQSYVDSYLKNTLNDVEFTKNIRWGGNPFEDYKDQIFAPTRGQGWTYGLNSPRELTSFVGKNGLLSLSTEHKDLLPPNFEVGSLLYKQRFLDQMSGFSGHGMNLEYYFEAQSVWDDTMAWNASEIMSKDSNQILVIIVGQFHVMYDLGLPSRLRTRGLSHIKTLVQSSAFADLNSAEIESVFDDPSYGLLADYFW